MSSLNNLLLNKLTRREEEGSLRRLSKNNGLIDFYSNDYLGLAQSIELAEAIRIKCDSLKQYKNGATGSRLLSGNSEYVQEVEEKLAKIFKSQSTLIFNSGYAANQAVLSSIPQKGDTILYDELSHACIKDGTRLSLAKKFSFKHNDVNDLERKIKKSTGQVFIAIESIYSMDGDEAPLREIISLKSKYNAIIILDEAHSTGVTGEDGSGIAVRQTFHNDIDVRIYTFGKAMGIHGACVAGSTLLINYLINFSRPFIYTTALPPHSIASIDCAFTYLQQNINLQNLLEKKIQHFQSVTSLMINKTNSNCAIQTALFPGNHYVKRIALSLQEDGFDVRPILSPTIQTGQERLRICLHAFNSEQEIEKLGAALKELSLS